MLCAADTPLESGFRDAFGLAKSQVVDKALPETVGAKLYREGMKFRYSQPLDSEKAFKSFKQGAEAGNANCAYELAVCYLRGIGVPMSQTKALEVLSNGMKMKDGSPINCEIKWMDMHLGLPFFDATKVKEYVRRLIQLSSKNEKAASMLWGLSGTYGSPPVDMVPLVDQMNAIASLKSMSASGNPSACFEYGKILLRPSTIADREEGLRLIQYAESKGVFGAQFSLYDYYSDTDIKPATAFEWLEKGWAAGDCRAGASLSYALIKGKGTAVDKKRAVEVALKVGEQGDAGQTYNIADFFTGYTGFDPSLSNFITWHRIAAEKGNTDSADQLGRIYSGEEVIGFKVSYPVSVDEALKYFTIGAYPDGEHNHVYRLNSLLCLGDMYRRGIGCKPDPDKAAKLYIEYLSVFRKVDFSGDRAFNEGGKVRMLWLKAHYPDVPGVPELNDSRLRFDGIVDYIHSFKHFGKHDFDYELFDEIAKLVSTRDKKEKENFQKSCSYVAREFGATDCLFHLVDLEYGKDFNSYSYAAYKDAALSGSASAAYRLHDMLFAEGAKPGTISAGPEYALKLSMGRTNRELIIAWGEAEAWRRFAASQEDLLNFGRSQPRNCKKIVNEFSVYRKFKEDDEISHIFPILRKINEAYREKRAQDTSGR